MLDVALHTGIGHPNLLWIGISSLMSFGVGVAVGAYTDESTPEPEPTVDTE